MIIYIQYQHGENLQIKSESNGYAGIDVSGNETRFTVALYGVGGSSSLYFTVPTADCIDCFNVIPGEMEKLIGETLNSF